MNRLLVGGKRPAGVDSGIGQGMEMTLTVVVFLGIGWLIDGWADTRPIFTIALVVFAMIGQFVRMWIDYDARMKVLEQERHEKSRGSRKAEGSSGMECSPEDPVR